MSRGNFSKVRLLKAQYNQTLNISSDEASTNSLGNLFSVSIMLLETIFYQNFPILFEISWVAPTLVLEQHDF